MGIDEDVVAADIGMEGGDVTNATHIRREVEDLIDAVTGRQLAILDLAKIKNLHLIGRTGFIFGVLKIGAPHPMAFPLQSLHEVMPNEPTRTSYQNPLLFTHPHSLLTDLRNLIPLLFVSLPCHHSET
jgi:hypothetical protein